MGEFYKEKGKLLKDHFYKNGRNNPLDMNIFQREPKTGAFSSQKILQNFCGTFTTLVRSIKYRLIIKLITRMDAKLRGESIKPN